MLHYPSRRRRAKNAHVRTVFAEFKLIARLRVSIVARARARDARFIHGLFDWLHLWAVRLRKSRSDRVVQEIRIIQSTFA